MSDCQPGLFCEDDVCCTEECDEGESCDVPGLEGTCSTAAPAPAVSQSVFPLVVGILLLLGGVAIVRSRWSS